MQWEIFLATVVTAVVVTTAILWLFYYAMNFNEETNKEAPERGDLKLDDTMEMEFLRSKVEDLQEEIVRLRNAIDVLLNLYGNYARANGQSPETPTEALITKQALLICSNEQMCETDRTAMRQAGVMFQRLRSATKSAVEADVRRRRMYRRMYPWVVYTGHADVRGTQMSDGQFAAYEWWAAIFDPSDRIELIIMNGCKTTGFADSLTGIISNVIIVYEDIDNIVAGRFLQAIFSQLRAGNTPVEAYARALTRVQGVSEYTEIFTRMEVQGMDG